MWVSDSKPSDTEFVVLRPASTTADSDMPSVFEGEWRKRADLADDSFVELLGAAGNVRAYPTDRTEQDRDGNVGQVYEVPEDAADELAADDQD
jgi:hypothetical protein